MAIVHLLSWVSGAGALLLFSPDLVPLVRIPFGSSGNWERSLGILRDLREKLETGWLPSEAEWAAPDRVDAPWGGLARECVAELREGGIPIVPTLRRLEKGIADQKKASQEARARTAQAWGQALVCGAIVPLIALALYFLVPGLSDLGWKWGLCAAAALVLDAAAMVWMLALSESARWGGLDPDRRSWWAASFCFGERLLGALRGGLPGDLAWARALPQLRRQAPSLIAYWGVDPESESVAGDARLEPAARSLVSAGRSLARAVRSSLNEGRGCGERIESVLDGLGVELDCEVERQVQLLSTRALKPLFVCVAPSVLLLLVLAFWLSFESWGIL